MAGPTPGPRSRRDPALDLLRGLALIRVVLWHTFAQTWMTLFAAIPLMFFVAGTLLAASGERRRQQTSSAGGCAGSCCRCGHTGWWSPPPPWCGRR